MALVSVASTKIPVFSKGNIYQPIKYFVMKMINRAREDCSKLYACSNTFMDSKDKLYFKVDFRSWKCKLINSEKVEIDQSEVLVIYLGRLLDRFISTREENPKAHLLPDLQIKVLAKYDEDLKISTEIESFEVTDLRTGRVILTDKLTWPWKLKPSKEGLITFDLFKELAFRAFSTSVPLDPK